MRSNFWDMTGHVTCLREKYLKLKNRNFRACFSFLLTKGTDVFAPRSASPFPSSLPSSAWSRRGPPRSERLLQGPSSTQVFTPVCAQIARTITKNGHDHEFVNVHVHTPCVQKPSCSTFYQRNGWAKIESKAAARCQGCRRRAKGLAGLGWLAAKHATEPSERIMHILVMLLSENHTTWI